MPVQGEDILKAIDAVLTFAERKKAEKKVKSAIEIAQKQGYKVEYKIDPATGQITPTISSREKGPYEDLMREMLQGQGGQGQGGQFEVSRLGPQGPSITRKQRKPEDLAIAKTLLQYGSNRPIPITIKGMQTQLDPNTAEGIEKGMNLVYGDNWRNDPELKAAGLPQLADQRIKELTTQQETAQAGAEPQIQPYATGIGRVGGAGAYYKDSVAKYGEVKTQQIVATAIKLQKQGMPLKKIAQLLKEAGGDPDLILKNYIK